MSSPSQKRVQALFSTLIGRGEDEVGGTSGAVNLGSLEFGSHLKVPGAYCG